MKKWKVGKGRGVEWVGVSRFFFLNLKPLIGSWFKVTKKARFFGNFKPFIICPIKKKSWGKKFLLDKKFFFLKKFYRFFFQNNCCEKMFLYIRWMYFTSTCNVHLADSERTCNVHWMYIQSTLKTHPYTTLQYMECTFCSATNLVIMCIGCTLWIRSMYFTCTCNVHFADREPTWKVHWMYIESTLKRHPYTTFNFIREWM